MKCLIKGCTNEINELLEFPAATGPRGEKLERLIERFAHEQELSRWTHLTLVANCSACLVLLSGHICPSHPLGATHFSIEAAAVPATIPEIPPSTLAPAVPAPVVRAAILSAPISEKPPTSPIESKKPTSNR